MKHACEKVSFLASKQLERRLSFTERFSMSFHFLMCSACKEYSLNIAKLHQVLQMLRVDKVQKEMLPESKRTEIEQNIQSFINKH